MSKASYIRLNRAKEALDSIAFDDSGQVKINHRLEAIKMILALIQQEKEENKHNPPVNMKQYSVHKEQQN